MVIKAYFITTHTHVYDIMMCVTCRDGVRFAFRESEEEEERYPNVIFLEVLCEFSFKLLQQDCVVL